MSKFQTTVLLLTMIALATGGGRAFYRDRDGGAEQKAILAPELTDAPLTVQPASQFHFHHKKGLDSWAASAWSMPAVKKAK